MRKLIIALIAVVLLLAAGAGVWRVSARGFGTRMEPTRVERLLARVIHRWAIPRSARAMTNPVPFSSDAWFEARAHFADHCASCHGNDGSGNTEVGRNLYPKAPDMRLADTQNLTDGEIYWIIENGVRLTGMPAWGPGGDNDLDTWKLVHLIRHVAHLTPDDLKAMERLNPKSPGEIDEERADDNFLSGGDAAAPSSETHDHHHQE